MLRLELLLGLASALAFDTMHPTTTVGTTNQATQQILARCGAAMLVVASVEDRLYRLEYIGIDNRFVSRFHKDQTFIVQAAELGSRVFADSQCACVGRITGPSPFVCSANSRRLSSRTRNPLHLMKEQRMSTRSHVAISFRSWLPRLASNLVPVNRDERESGLSGRSFAVASTVRWIASNRCNGVAILRPPDC